MLLTHNDFLLQSILMVSSLSVDLISVGRSIYIVTSHHGGQNKLSMGYPENEADAEK